MIWALHPSPLPDGMWQSPVPARDGSKGRPEAATSYHWYSTTSAAAIVAYVLGESWTDPQIAEVAASEAEDLAYVRKVGGTGFDGIQSLTDLRNNWNRLLDSAGLTPDERKQAVQMFNHRVAPIPGTRI